MSVKTKQLTGRKRIRFCKKYDKYMREKREIPSVGGGIETMKEVIEEMEPIKRHFLWGYRWRAEGAAKKK